MRKIPHVIYYLIELIILASGFYYIYRVASSFQIQLIVLSLILIFYTIFGILHHEMHHSLYKKIVIEYVLISLIILALFVFLNIGKI